MLKDGDVYNTFIKEVVKKTSSQFTTFWKRAIFTGKGTPPKDFGDDATLVKFVAETPGAIGFVSAAAAKDGVKS